MRVGLIVPSSNTVVEVDFYRRLPEGSTLHTARMYLEQTTPEAEEDMLDLHLPVALRDVASARPDMVVFGCTSAGALRGNDAEARLVARIADHTQAETISVAAAVRAAIAARQARRVGVITPYVESLNDKIRESLEADGLHVVGIHGLGMTENFAIASLTPERIAAFAAECFHRRDIDLLFASCTNMRAFDACGLIEEAVGVPVITSNQAAYEMVAQRLGAVNGA